MAPENRIRIFIVDDHAMVRYGLRAFLDYFEDVEFVGEANTAQQAIELCRQLQPDVALLDMRLPDMDGPSAAQALLEQIPHMRIIALTSFTDETLVKHAIQAGVTGYLLKDAEPAELVEAIRSVYKGQPSLSPFATRALMQAAIAPPAIGADLTPRELEVLAQLVDGLTNAEIARSLTLSVPTVNFHIRNILAKLNASNRTEAAKVALQYHLVGEE